MREYVLTLLVAAAVTYLLTPLIRRVAIVTGAVHAPRERDVHTVRTPRLGGLAMYTGLAAALVVADRLAHLHAVIGGTRFVSGLLLAGGLIVVIGAVDDRWGIGALTKLAGQVAAGVILVWSGTELDWIPIPGGTFVLSPNEGLVLTIFVVVLTINAVNFIDGLDGLAAGIVGIAALAYFAYSYALLRVSGGPTQSQPALASAILAGMCLGFLPHNFYPARVFMGDTGSMLIGLLLAYAPLSSTANIDPYVLHYTHVVNRFPTILPILLPAAIFLIPYADLLLAVVRRVRARQSPFTADKKHLHHRLLSIGHSHRKSVLLMYLWAILFAGTVVGLSVLRTKLLILVGVTVACVLTLLLVSVPRLRPRRVRAPRRDRAGEAAPRAQAGPAGAAAPQTETGPAAARAPRAPRPARSVPARTVPIPVPGGSVAGSAADGPVRSRARGDDAASLCRECAPGKAYAKRL